MGCLTFLVLSRHWHYAEYVFVDVSTQLSTWDEVGLFLFWEKWHVSLLMKSVAEAPCCWFCSFLSVVDVVVKRI